MTDRSAIARDPPEFGPTAGGVGIPFVDAHVHLWDLGRLHYPWLSPPFRDDGPNGNVAAIAGTVTLDNYLAAAARWNVAGMVHVEAGAEPAATLVETGWLRDMGERRGLPSGIVAFAALEDGAVETRLAEQAAHARVRGIRQIVNWHGDPCRTYTPRDLTVDPAWQAGYARLAAHGLSFDLQCYPAQMPVMAELAAQHPDVPVILNHLGMPVTGDPEGVDDWRRGMRRLARYPQVTIKISGFGFIDRRWRTEQVRPFVREAIDLFGPERCLFASDFPTDLLFADLDRQMDACHAMVADLSEDERRAMFGRNADRVYRLGLGV